MQAQEKFISYATTGSALPFSTSMLIASYLLFMIHFIACAWLFLVIHIKIQYIYFTSDAWAWTRPERCGKFMITASHCQTKLIKLCIVYCIVRNFRLYHFTSALCIAMRLPDSAKEESISFYQVRSHSIWINNNWIWNYEYLPLEATKTVIIF